MVANANPMLSAAIFTKIQSGMRPSDGKVYCAPRNKLRSSMILGFVSFNSLLDGAPTHVIGLAVQLASSY